MQLNVKEKRRRIRQEGEHRFAKKEVLGRRKAKGSK